MKPNRRQKTLTASDELLAIRCQLGEREAFDDLIDRYADRLRGYVRRVASSDAEADDLVQDTWLRILRGLPGLRDPGRLRSWLFGIAHRVIIDRLRLRYTEPVHAPVDALVDEEDVQAEHLRHDEVERGLAALVPVEREAVVLFYLEQLTLAEMAEVMAVPVGTAKSRLHRARKRLRAALESPHAPETTGETG